MRSCKDILNSLKKGEFDETLKSLYALDGTNESLMHSYERVERVIRGLMETYGFDENQMVAIFSGPGRTEIGGNHTDHQHGRVLCGSVDLDMLACATPNSDNVIRILSEGYPKMELALDSLKPQESEKNTSRGLVRGVAAGVSKASKKIGGFTAYITSSVLSGSGLSSSAAYEILIGNIFNEFYGAGLDAIQLAKIGQFSENEYFGKPCGLMDQMGSSVGSAVAIDFMNPKEPIVKKVDYDFSKSGHALCIIDTGSCHADLTDDYAEITIEMKKIASHFGKKVLRDVDEKKFYASIPSLRKECGDRAVLRAMHFYADDKRANLEVEALEKGDFNEFLRLINESGRSSAERLQNIWSVSAPKNQAVSLSLALGQDLLGGSGAIRVHGGGFAGTIQAFVPIEKLNDFKNGMEAVLGKGKCHVLHIRPVGGCVVIA